MRISNNAIQVMDHLIQDMLDRLAKDAGGLARYSKRMTMFDKHIQGAVMLMFPNELAKYACEQGEKAVDSVCRTTIE